MRKKDKHSNQIPVPIGGMSSSRPLKFKLSSQGTISKNQKDSNDVVLGRDYVYKDKSIYKELGNCCDMRKPNKKVINLFKRMPYRDLVKHIREEEVQALKMIYFKGWLLSRE